MLFFLVLREEEKVNSIRIDSIFLLQIVLFHEFHCHFDDYFTLFDEDDS